MWRRQARDLVWRTHVGNLRVSAVMARNSIAEEARRWELSPTEHSSRLWAEYMTGTAMLSSFFKGEERIKMVLRASTNEEVYVESLAIGEVRGKATLLPGSDSSVFENGEMEVSKIIYGSSTPYTTTVPATGNAQGDWQAFYDISEQVPTVVRIDHDAKDDILRCGGLTIQKMPGSESHDRQYELSDLRFDSVPFSVSDMEKNTDVLDYLNELIPNANLKGETCHKVPLDYFCRCSKTTFGTRLAGLGSEYLHDLIKDTEETGIELSCHFCNEKYHFSTGDMKEIVLTGVKQ